MTRVLQGATDPGHATVHHVRWGDDVCPGVSVGQCLPDKGVHRHVVKDIAFAVDDAILPVSGERIKRDIGDDPPFRETLLDGAEGALREAIRVPRLAAVFSLALRCRHREQRDGRHPQLEECVRLANEAVYTESLDTRHGVHRLAPTLAVEHK